MFILSLLIVIIVDWTIMRKILGRKIVFFAEMILLICLIIVYIYHNSYFFYKINDNTKWFVVVYSDKIQDNKIEDLFPLNKVVEISNETLNFIDKQKFAFRSEQLKYDRDTLTYYRKYEYVINSDTITQIKYNWDEPSFVIYEIEPYKLTQSDFNIINTKIKKYLNLGNVLY